MDIVINEELKAYIDPLTPDEYEALERSLLAEGCRDALVLWGDLLVDGHNRYEICSKHDLPFQTVQSKLFKDIEDVHLWMIDQHLGRRSVSDFQRGVLALRKREIVAARRARFLETSARDRQGDAAEADGTVQPGGAPPSDLPWEGESSYPDPAPLKSREDLARAARLSSSQVAMIEKIREQAEPELVAALKSGEISISAAAAVATLPPEEQKAAAVAGKDELKQVAKRVREARRKPRAVSDRDGSQEPAAGDATADAAASAELAGELQVLQKRVAELSAENEALRKQVANLLQQLVG